MTSINASSCSKAQSLADLSAAGGHHCEQHPGHCEHQAVAGLWPHRPAADAAGVCGEAMGQAAAGERQLPGHPVQLLLCAHVHPPAAAAQPPHPTLPPSHASHPSQVSSTPALTLTVTTL